MLKDKIIEDPILLIDLLDALRKDPNYKVVFTNGCFDLLHPGHVLYLEQAKLQGDTLIVAINTDESVRKLKGPSRPIQSQEDRAIVLAGLSSIDFVIFFAEETPIDLIKLIKPNVLVKGGDWAVDQIVGGKEVVKNGGVVKSIEFVEGKSTTDIETQILRRK